ncbi:MAG: hypothetical protein KatS3mg077_0608 [Candidatus Binatia bacterium]|nr:MAG: hypothetical protein KatS3mg077_0608 [Candidatus Binatia bacterium]
MIFECGLAAETQVETPEGPMEIRKVAGKQIPVFTRESSGRVRFRLMRDVRLRASAVPVLKVRLDNGGWFRALPRQGVFLQNLECATLDQIRPGTLLCPAFHYPPGYRYRTDGGDEQVSAAGWQVVAIEPDGEADVYSLTVFPERCFFVSAGVLLRSD